VSTSPSSLRRTLSLRDLIVYGLLFIGPLAPVGVFGVLDARADGAVALVYLLATVAMGFTAWSYAEMSGVVPHAASVFAYAREGLGGGARRLPKRAPAIGARSGGPSCSVCGWRACCSSRKPGWPAC